MRWNAPSRRSFVVGTTALLGGCLGGGSGSNGTVTNETDGYPPRAESTPAESTPDERSIDTESFERITVEGTDVPLAPLDVAYYWFRRREARFADARGRRSYDQSHVLGAVLSPAPDGGGGSDPVAAWPTDDRIVCYCGCPHHLSSIRAANLLQNGYEEVYVIDEGFWAWHDSGYPMAGEAITDKPASFEITGRADPRHAGESVWAWHEPSGQREAAPVGADGRYVLELRFTDVTRESSILVDAPGYRVRDSLGALVDGVVTGPGR